MTNEELTKYISLQEATKYCRYSQEYLSLRARQGKLKAVKLGRNWVTTKEWLEEYLRRTEEYNNNLAAKRVRRVQEKVPPPINLPAGDFNQAGPARLVEARRKLAVLRFGAVGLIIFVIFFSGTIFTFRFIQNTLSLEKITKNVPSFVYIRNESGDVVIGEIEDVVQSWAVVSKGAGAEALRETVESFGRQLRWVGRRILALGERVKTLSKKIVCAFKSITYLWENTTKPKRMAEEQMSSPAVREGMVVVPSTGRDEEVKKKIKSAFSDEVRVEPKDKESGIIVPIFRERVGEKYMYVLVPVEKSE